MSIEITDNIVTNYPPIDLQFYRTRAAMRIKLRYPEIRRGRKYPTPGGFMFNFAAAAQDGSNKYDWENFIPFFLSANEVGSFLNAMETSQNISLYHDPDIGTTNEGTRAKSLSFNITDGNSFINVSMGSNRLGISVSSGDIRQICLLLGHSLRICYGWF